MAKLFAAKSNAIPKLALPGKPGDVESKVAPKFGGLMKQKSVKANPAKGLAARLTGK